MAWKHKIPEDSQDPPEYGDEYPPPPPSYSDASTQTSTRSSNPLNSRMTSTTTSPLAAPNGIDLGRGSADSPLSPQQQGPIPLSPAVRWPFELLSPVLSSTSTSVSPSRMRPPLQLQPAPMSTRSPSALPSMPTSFNTPFATAGPTLSAPVGSRNVPLPSSGSQGDDTPLIARVPRPISTLSTPVAASAAELGRTCSSQVPPVLSTTNTFNISIGSIVIQLPSTSTAQPPIPVGQGPSGPLLSICNPATATATPLLSVSPPMSASEVSSVLQRSIADRQTTPAPPHTSHRAGVTPVHTAISPALGPSSSYAQHAERSDLATGLSLNSSNSTTPTQAMATLTTASPPASSVQTSSDHPSIPESLPSSPSSPTSVNSWTSAEVREANQIAEQVEWMVFGTWRRSRATESTDSDSDVEMFDASSSPVVTRK